MAIDPPPVEVLDRTTPFIAYHTGAGKGKIFLCQGFFNRTIAERRAILAHELCHAWRYMKNPKLGRRYMLSRSCERIEEYIADHVAALLENSSLLALQSRLRYRHTVAPFQKYVEHHAKNVAKALQRAGWTKIIPRHA